MKLPRAARLVGWRIVRSHPSGTDSFEGRITDTLSAVPIRTLPRETAGETPHLKRAKEARDRRRAAAFASEIAALDEQIAEKQAELAAMVQERAHGLAVLNQSKESKAGKELVGRDWDDYGEGDCVGIRKEHDEEGKL